MNVSKYKKLYMLLIVIVIFSLTGCASDSSQNSTEQITTEADATEADATETDAKKQYVHGADGYYCIYDDMPEFEAVSQKWGTCWLYAAAASMRTAYYKENGKDIKIDPIDLLDIIFGGGTEKEEGVVVKSGDIRNVGGSQVFVTATLSRGFGDHLTLDSTMNLDIKDRDTIKEVIRNRGGIVVEIPDNTDGKKGVYGGCFTMNDTETEEFDHDVTIVGYDDHFPKEFFKEEAAEDGAWLAYNSNYKSDKPYYISYCSNFGYVMSHTVTDKYSEVLSYDVGSDQGREISTGESTKVANVFHKEGKLAAVGTYNFYNNQDIKIEIYDASFQELLYSQDAVLDYPGYHTIKLDKQLDVTDYAIAITYSEAAPVEGDDTDIDDYEIRTISESGQSYVYIDGWKDLTDSDIKDVLEIKFEPNNCCIKALYE